jgi:1-acyl-sn-glycerol-3-phosphate acyltransferase
MTVALDRAAVAAYRDRITDEIVKAMGISPQGLLRRVIGPFFRLPAGRFAAVMARADAAIRVEGLPGGGRSVLRDFGLEPVVRGAESIPAAGPLIVASNHPGAYDSVALMAAVPRPDLKVVLSDVGFTRAFEAAGRHFVFAAETTAGRSRALRDSLRHLEAGGALLIYPHTEVEPDPETSPGAAEALADWSRSLEIMARRVPAAAIQVAIASGVILPRFARHPFVRVRRDPARRQKLAEFLQVATGMVFPRLVRPRIHLSFAEPVAAARLPAGGVGPAVLAIARRLLESHLSAVRAETA